MQVTNKMKLEIKEHRPQLDKISTNRLRVKYNKEYLPGVKVLREGRNLWSLYKDDELLKTASKLKLGQWVFVNIKQLIT